MYKLLIVDSIDESGCEFVKDRLGRTVELDSLPFAKKVAGVAERKLGPIQVVKDTGLGFVPVKE